MKKLLFLLLGLVAASNAFALVPADPTNVTWYDCGDESGHSYLSFTLPTVDVNGNALDIEMMGYRIYIDDDQIVSFNSAQYENIWGTTTDIYQYNWEAGSDLQSGGVYFYRTNADGYDRFFNNRIGIQVFYLNDNFAIGGVSNIVYTEVSPQAGLPKPANPQPDDWLEWGDFMEEFSFSMGTDVDGNPVADDYTVDKYYNNEEYTILDEDKVSYSIYTDNDQIFTFTPEEFPDDVTEETTEIPFGYAGIKMDASYCIYFEDRPVGNVTEGRFFEWRIGVQMNYTDNGQKSSSDIVYMEIIPQLKEAAEVTPTSFLADWSCDAENTYMRSNFDGYDLIVINKETRDTIVINNVTPTNTYQDAYGNTHYLPGATCNVEGLTPGATYEFCVVWRHNYGAMHTVYSAVREVILPQEGHGYDLGDVNHDNTINISDLTVLIDYLLGSATDACPICADVNADGDINIADVTALVDMLLGAN